MASEAQPFNFRLGFVVPADHILAVARDHVDSPDENWRAAAKALLDFTAIGAGIQEAISVGRNADLAPYFDFWTGDAIECATRMFEYPDLDAQNLAHCLIDLEKTAIESKVSFVEEAKRNRT